VGLQKFGLNVEERAAVEVHSAKIERMRITVTRYWMPDTRYWLLLLFCSYFTLA
jgi:hypothetical protein